MVLQQHRFTCNRRSCAFAMASSSSKPPTNSVQSRKKLIIVLAILSVVLFGLTLAQSSFDLPFINPSTNQQIVFLGALSMIVFFLFVALTFVLMRNLIKVFAERRLGVLGSKFRTRLVVGSLLLSFVPVIVMFWFSYGLMNRSIERWFSSPVEEVQRDTAIMADILARYAAENAESEAISIASSPDTQRAFEGHSFSGVINEFRARKETLQGGFAIAIQDGNSEASFGLPAAWGILKEHLPLQPLHTDRPHTFHWDGTEYILGSAPVGDHGEVLVAMPLPRSFADTQKQLEASQRNYLQLARERRQ